jgi:epoxyqueuosine reductase
MAQPLLDSSMVLSAARAAGFDRAAVVPLSALGEVSLDGWLEAGRQGEMRYLERHARVRRDPAAAFPGFRSAVIAVTEYGAAGEAPADPSAGNIARYALSDDYHETVKTRLRGLGDALRAASPGLRTRPLVDANPLNEKVLARIGGLGFVGKHSNLILEGRGSWFFCGVLLLSEELDGREPMARNRCGLCTRCIDVCPTGAIVEPYVVDARLCISYLTIELEGAIPRELRPAVGNRIFGCDDCQEACPWNRFAKREVREPFTPRAGLQGRPLAEWLEIEAPEFDALFAHSAVARAGHRGFLRNVLVAAGNSQNPNLLPLVARRLGDPDALIRAHAAWALGRLGGAPAAEILRSALAAETDVEVRSELGAALAEAQGGVGPPISGSSEFGKIIR